VPIKSSFAMGNSSCKRDVERKKQAGKNCAAARMDNVSLPTLLTCNANAEKQSDNVPLPTLLTSNANMERQRELAKEKFDHSFMDHSFALRSRAASDIQRKKPKLIDSTVSRAAANQQPNFPHSVSDSIVSSALDRQQQTDSYRSVSEPGIASSGPTNDHQQKFHRSISEELGYTYVGSRCVRRAIDKQGTFEHSFNEATDTGAARKAPSRSASSDSVHSDENRKHIRGPGWFQAKRSLIKRPSSHIRV